MRFLATFQTYDFLDTLVSLTAAFILGTLIGAERQYRLRTAGLRTNVLVAVSAAAFVDLAMHLTAEEGAVRVIAYVVSGIGFLGAGVIMKEGMNVRGLNTAATLWGSAAVGSCAGADMIAQATALTVFVLAGNTLLRPLVNAINRSPLDEKASEATYEFMLTVDAASMSDMRELLVEKLEAAQYPVSDVNVIDRADDVVEIVATLVSTAVDARELDAVAADLARRAARDMGCQHKGLIGAECLSLIPCFPSQFLNCGIMGWSAPGTFAVTARCLSTKATNGCRDDLR
jgi:putative Mg2+ transporter-C (MgtC) family protein